MPRTPPEIWGELFNFAGGGLVHMELFGDSAMLHRRVTIGDGTIRSLEATNLILIPFPATGYRLVPFFVQMTGNFIAGHYGNTPDNAFMVFTLNGPDDSVVTNAYIGRDDSLGIDQLQNFFSADYPSMVVNFLTAYQDPASIPIWNIVPLVNLGATPNPYKNTKMELAYINGAGELSGGNPANSLTFDIYYAVVPAT